MGTNFYYIRKIEDSDKAELNERLDEVKRILNENDNARELRASVSSLLDYIEYDMKKTTIHIGKRSCGWQFLFNHNDFKFYSPTLESIRAFLNSGDGKIIDEYGDEYTAEEFWNNEVGESLYYKKDVYINGEEYYSKPENLRYFFPSDRMVEHNGTIYMSKYYEYTINGLRFSDSKEFS